MYKLVLAGIARFVLIGLMTIGTQASAEDFKGRMDCTVKTNQVIEVSDVSEKNIRNIKTVLKLEVVYYLITSMLIRD